MSLLFDRLKDKLELHTGKVRLSTQSPCIQEIQEEISSKLNIWISFFFYFLYVSPSPSPLPPFLRRSKAAVLGGERLVVPVTNERKRDTHSLSPSLYTLYSLQKMSSNPSVLPTDERNENQEWEEHLYEMD